MQLLLWFDRLRDAIRAARASRQPRPQSPRHVAYVELSSICNAACVFCSYPILAQDSDRLKQMSGSVFARTLELLLQLGYRQCSFTPTTGEVFANPQWPDFFAQALQNEKIESVYFYSNGILLTEKNIARILELPNLHKLAAVHLSVGGTDKATYHRMFGVDKFAAVQRNINALCKALADRQLTIKVCCEARIPKTIKLATTDIERTFNLAGYRHFRAEVLRFFDPLGGLVTDKELRYLPPVRDKSKLCYRLGDIRFDARGGIWMCGCVVSERPGDTSLRIGSTDDQAEDIMLRQTEIISRWRQGHLPTVCAGCRVYKPAAGNDHDLLPDVHR